MKKKRSPIISLLCLTILISGCITRANQSSESTVNTAPLPRDNSRPAPFSLFPSTSGGEWEVWTKSAPSIPEETQSWPYTGGIPVNATIDVSDEIAPITPWQFGVNITLWCGRDWLLDSDRIEKARQAGIRFWRFPGGSASNSYFWDGDYLGRSRNHQGRDPSVMSQSHFVQTDDFIQFCSETDAQAIFTLNYGAARYFDVETAADLAVEWIDYVRETKGFDVQYWEVGNECYGPWEDGYTLSGRPSMDGTIYGRDYLRIAERIWTKHPDIYLGAPSVYLDGGEQYFGYKWWMRDMLPLIQSNVDFLVQHHYFGSWPYENNRFIAKPNSDFLNHLDDLQDVKNNNDEMVSRYTDLEEEVPIAFTEFNLNESPEQTIELFNSLYISELLGRIVENHIPAANIWDWQNTLDSKTGGDHGMLAHEDDRVPEATPRPSYYSYALFHRAFGDTMVRVDQYDDQTKVWASRFNGGELGLIIINWSGETKDVNLELQGFEASGKWQAWSVTGENLNSRQISFNGKPGPQGGGGPFPLDSIPPYTGEFPPDQSPVISVPPYSLTGVVIY